MREVAPGSETKTPAPGYCQRQPTGQVSGERGVGAKSSGSHSSSLSPDPRAWTPWGSWAGADRQGRSPPLQARPRPPPPLHSWGRGGPGGGGGLDAKQMAHRPAPAPEAELAAGRGLRASGFQLGNPARPPHSPLSKAPAKPPDAASPGPAAQGAPTGRRPDAGAARGAPQRAPRRRSHQLLAPRADILDFAVASDPPSKSFDPCALSFALRPPAGPVPCLPPTGLPGRPLAALRAGHPVPQPGSFSLPIPAHVTVLSVPASGPF